jgi:metal-responsive CopG/Arc/MetJ family transcriptional regulator
VMSGSLMKDVYLKFPQELLKDVDSLVGPHFASRNEALRRAASDLVEKYRKKDSA